MLYIGKATNLRDRVRSYFGRDLPKSRGPMLVKMLEEAKSITWEKTDSVLEALILEANLIKKHQPTYNTKDKSDTSFNYVVITKEDFPRVLVVRGSELASKVQSSKLKTSFGPFTQGSVLKEALKIVRKIFPYRDKCLPFEASAKKGRSCFNAQINLCPGVCSGEIGKREYARTVRNIVLLFRGKKSVLIKKLQKEMRAAAKAEDFELAASLRNKIFTLEHINDTSLIKDEIKQLGSTGRIEAYDVAHISETARVGVMVVVQDGEAARGEYRKFKIKTKTKGDVAALKEILERRFGNHGSGSASWRMPKLIVVDGAKAQMNCAQKVLKEFGYKIPVVAVTKDEKHRPKQILTDVGTSSVSTYEKEVLLANAEAHRFAVSFHRKRRSKSMR